MPKKKVKELVSLRRKPVSGGGSSLFLDYTVDGFRRKEYLKMYLVAERTDADREQNRQTMLQAQGMKAKRTAEIMSGNTGFLKERKETSETLLSYMGKRKEFYSANGQASTARGLSSVMKLVSAYGDIPLRKLGKEYLTGLLAHFGKSGLGKGSQANYWGRIVTVLSSARREGLMESNPAELVDPRLKPSAPPSIREHLTLEEVRKLASAPMGGSYPQIKDAFMFACFTGLRISDVRQLTWKQIVPMGEGRWQIEKVQQKTGGSVFIPLSANAMAWLPEMRSEGNVFGRLPISPNVMERAVASWVKSAGITKKVTFHVSRHTFATLLLEYGTDIYTVSSMLGHSSVATTQIYAKVVDSRKRKAADSIPEL